MKHLKPNATKKQIIEKINEMIDKYKRGSSFVEAIGFEVDKSRVTEGATEWDPEEYEDW